MSYGITPTNEDVLTTYWAPTTAFTAKTTRLCDGRIRAVGSLTPHDVGSTLSTDVPTVTYTGPAPSCSVQPSDCEWLHSSYLSADSSYSAYQTKNPDAVPGNPPTMPRCYVSDLSNKACGQCTLHGGNVQLLYFPLTTKTSRNMCVTAPTSSTMCPYGPTHANNDTINGFATAPCSYINTQHTPTTDSGPSTIINGTTMYSNRAYISYDTLYATNSCGRVGGTYANGLATLASSDIFSVSGYHFELSHAAYSFNFADLAAPIPASAYLCQANCDSSGSPLADGDSLNGEPPGKLGFCNTIIDEAFRPRLAVPPQMRAIDPVFESCLLGLDGLYDPPRIMTSESALDGPDGSPPPTSSPEPASSVAQSTAKPTAAPERFSSAGGEDESAGAGSHAAATNAGGDDENSAGGSDAPAPTNAGGGGGSDATGSEHGPTMAANGDGSDDAAGSIAGPSDGPSGDDPNAAASLMGPTAGGDGGPDAAGSIATPTHGPAEDGSNPSAGSPFSPTAIAESRSPSHSPGPADVSSLVETSGTAAVDGPTSSDPSATGESGEDSSGDAAATTQGSLASRNLSSARWFAAAAGVCFNFGFWI